MHQSTAVGVIVVATIVLMSALPHGEARSIHGQYVADSNLFTAEEAWRMREERRREREMLEAMEVEIDRYEEFEMTPPVDPPQINEKEDEEELFEGDIVLTERQKMILNEAELLENGQAKEQAFRASIAYRWFNREVPYVLDKSLNKESTDAINDAMDEIEEKTKKCITFKLRGTERDYVRFKSGKGCSSLVGRYFGEQIISIMNRNENGTCGTKGIAMHEIIHALGRFHEQSRPDRDDYVTIMLDNIKKDDVHNFKKRPASTVDMFGTSYDFYSIMHYGAKYFAIDSTKPTIVPKDPKNVITGQREYLTDNDVYQIVAAYCPDKKDSFPHSVQ